MNILLTDRSWPYLHLVAKDLASILEKTNHVILLSEKEKSFKIDNFQIINIHDIPLRNSIDYFQRKYPFSIYKTIVCERAFTDYSSFRVYSKYSNSKELDIEYWIELYVNAFDYLFSNNLCDVVIENAPDCFIPPLNCKIAEFYKINYFSIHLTYWHENGIFFFDRSNWTSSHLDKKILFYDTNQNLIKRENLDFIFSSKKTMFFKRLPQRKERLRQLFNRSRSYNPISLKHLGLRTFYRLVNKFQIKFYLNWKFSISSKSFVLFPLHISPEASLLGNTPELADQFSVIKNISMNLPWGVTMYVKEHPHVLEGHGLDYSFYKKIQSLNNVELLHKSIQLDSIYNDERFIAVMGINGTVCFDAALARKAVIIFGNPYFKQAECFIKVSSYSQLNDILKSILDKSWQFSEKGLYSLLAALDDLVVTSNDVDFSKENTTMGIALAYNKIIKEFIEKRNFYAQ